MSRDDSYYDDHHNTNGNGVAADDIASTVSVPSSFRERRMKLAVEATTSTPASATPLANEYKTPSTKSAPSYETALIVLPSPTTSVAIPRHTNKGNQVIAVAAARHEEERVRSWLRALRLHVLPSLENGYLLTDPYRNGVLLSDLASILVCYTILPLRVHLSTRVGLIKVIMHQ
jgi:hypothetical protein